MWYPQQKKRAFGLGKKSKLLSGLFCGVAAFVVVACTTTETNNQHERSIEVLRVLSSDSMEGRRTGTPGIAAARAYLIKQLDELGVEKPLGKYESEFTFERAMADGATKNYQGINLVASIPGTLPSGEGKRPTLVLTAHYDHEGVRGGEIYNGADDNASGVGALFAVIEDFKNSPPPNDTLFVLFDAEELGLQGARVFVEEIDTLNGICAAFNINLDMVSRNEKNELYVAGTFHNPDLKPVMDEIAAKSPVKLLQGHDSPEDGAQDWTLQSDHGPFHRAGIPFAYFGVEDHPHYHRPSDDFETVPLDFYRRSIDTISMASRLINQRLDTVGRSCGVAE